MKLVIVLPSHFELWTAPAWFAPRLRQEFPDLEVVEHHRYREAEQDLRDADAAMTFVLRPEHFRAARKLRWIHSPAAAVHQLLIPEIVASDVIVTNGRGVHGPVVAEHALALILALSKCLHSAMSFQAKHTWALDLLWQENPRPREISGATLGLVGVGSIGGELARRAEALGMRVMAVREHPQKGADWRVPGDPPPQSVVYGPDGLDSMLRESDYVVLAAPLTGKTQALMDARRLASMKPNACLVNVSRGALVDETALANALQARHLGGAALDVFEHEPLPPESPLWDLPNLLITPHSAALTDKLWQRHYDLLADNLRRYFAGQPLRMTVDKNKGY